jgi:hypothetical protein
MAYVNSAACSLLLTYTTKRIDRRPHANNFPFQWKTAAVQQPPASAVFLICLASERALSAPVLCAREFSSLHCKLDCSSENSRVVNDGETPRAHSYANAVVQVVQLASSDNVCAPAASINIADYILLQSLELHLVIISHP